MNYSKGLEYSLNNDGKSFSVVGIGTCTDTEIIIPSRYEGLPVTEIGYDAFWRCNSVTSIEIPNSVTSIGDWAFASCTSLTNIMIPDSIVDIGSCAFYGCSSLQYNEYDNALYLGNKNNSYCVLIAVKNSNITSCLIHENTRFIYEEAYVFDDCTLLTSIEVDENNKYYQSIDGNLYTKDGKTLIQYALGKSDTFFAIPNHVITIGYGAFDGCSSLVGVEIPESVKVIDGFAFADCNSIAELYYSGNVESWLNISLGISDASQLLMLWGYNLYFEGELVTNLVIPDTVTNIRSGAFAGCTSIVSVVIPSSVTNIGEYEGAFMSCSSLIEVCNKSSLNITPGSYDNGQVASNAKHIITDQSESYLKYRGEYIFYDDGTNVYLVKYCGKDTKITLPEYQGGKSYEIMSHAFYKNSYISTIVIPDYVTGIGMSAFSDCTALKSVKVGNSVTSIDDGAFWNCYSLTSIILGNSVTKIGGSAFDNCNSLQYNEYDNALYLGNANNPYYALIKATDTGITKCKINSKTKIIADDAFFNCYSLSNIGISNSVTNIGEMVFHSCRSLTNIEIPNSVVTIGYMAFGYCDSLKSIVIPDSVTNISPYIFYRCTSLSSVAIGESVTNIENNAFDYCNSLASITIPDSVIYIGNDAFRSCTKLTIYCEAATKLIGWSESWNPNNRPVVWGLSQDQNLIFALNNDGFSYSVISVIDRECTYIVIPKIFKNLPVTAIGNEAFRGCVNLTEVVIPDSVTNIGNYAFYNCQSMLNIEIPNSVTNIGSYAFSGCVSFTNIEIPNSVIRISNGAFSGCTSLTNIIISNSVSVIYEYTFARSTSLTNITIPSSVTKIRSNAFSGCESLTSIVIPNSVTSISEWAFSGCIALSSAVIPRSVTSRYLDIL